VSERGYSLVELVISVAILLAVLGSVCQLASPAHATALIQAELQDMHQRARVLNDRLTFDLHLAGAGVGSGVRRGPLGSAFTAVLPAACCGSIADPPGTERTDRLTVLYVPRGSPEAITASAVSPGSLTLDLAAAPACPAALCGFADGDLLVVFDGSGGYDLFTLDLSSGVAMLAPKTTPFVASYAAGATVARIVARTYYRDAASNQVFVADAGGVPEPFIDRVADLRFSYTDQGDGILDGRLGDGPWLGAGGSLYDADARRVRRVHVSYTVRSALPGSGPLNVPDLNCAFDVSLRNVPGGA
jgi:type II secretory pathway pseudopilin PulG